MASKFADFITEKKIDPRRLRSVSKRIERLRPEDRRLKRAKRASGDDKKKPAAEGEAAPKPHSGRPITPRLLAQATTGEAISGAAKTRLLRAVNQILTARKEAVADLRQLF